MDAETAKIPAPFLTARAGVPFKRKQTKAFVNFVGNRADHS